jgi:D-alanyl-D-alanine carboxypeptidase/D-alanyl-D-alanine-endopeptidase (penicillin-binding protein 4)
LIRSVAPGLRVLILGAVLAPACAGNAAPVVPAGSDAAPATRPSGSSSRALRELRAQLTEVFNAPIMSRGVWAVDVRSLDTGEPLFDLNAGKLTMPASNMKIVTMAAAAEILGWDYRFTTAIETTAPIEHGVLHGDLFIRGTGDPTISARDNRASAVLFDWIVGLRHAGITRIAGRIIGDDQAFDDEGLGDGWSWDYLQYGYAAPSGALQFNENVAQLTIAPGVRAGEPAFVTLPAGTGLTLLNRATTGAEGSAATIDYRLHLSGSVLEITGSIPAGAPSLSRSVAVVNPTVYFVQSVKDALVSAGIAVSGEAVDYDDVAAELVGATERRRVLVTTESPTLREMGTVLMKVSQNMYAETFIKAIGAAEGGIGTTGGGRTAVRRLLTSWDIPRDAYIMSDGSGLSRYNYVSAEMITAILERMYRDPRHNRPFALTLPIAGKDGTISSRMQGSLAEGNAVAKTGSIANVRSLSGYVRTRDGEMLVFSILANDFPIPAGTVTWIADLAVEILAAFTRG